MGYLFRALKPSISQVIIQLQPSSPEQVLDHFRVRVCVVQNRKLSIEAIDASASTSKYAALAKSPKRGEKNEGEEPSVEANPLTLDDLRKIIVEF